ncbi:MAG: DUF456 domain-containing protein [Lachnospiraceae bacterium]|nr:DUF456 domain-containing protein [Lachnospiraceae bacterium]
MLALISLSANTSFLGIALIFLLLAFGFLGCFVNKFPGPLLCFIAIFLAKVAFSVPISWGIIVLIAILVAASMFFLNKYLPILGQKVAPFTKGAQGTLLGSIIGVILICLSKSTTGLIILMIIGLVLIPFGLAYLMEYSVQKDSSAALSSAIGATVTYLCSTCVKLVIFCLSIYAVFDSWF